MNNSTKLTEIKPGVVYYTDLMKDCEVTLNRVQNNSIFFNVIYENNSGYVFEDDGTLVFSLSSHIYFYEK
jgi:hypothetical protein